MEITDEQFERYVEEAWKKIPDHFKFEMKNVSIRIENNPTSGQLRRAKAYTLLGLFEGHSKTEWGQATFGDQPSKISIFQEPVARSARNEEELKNLIQEVLMHEVAHYFGYNDEDMCVLDEKLRKKLRQKDHPENDHGARERT